MAKVTYTPEGADKPVTIEVEPSAITYGEDEKPSGYVPKERFEEEIKRRVTAAKNNAKTDLSDDDEYFRELAEARGYEFREDGRLKGSAKDAAEQEDRWKKQHLAPLQTKLQIAEERIQKMLDTQKANEILLAADGVKPSLKEAFIREVSGKLHLDDATNKFAVKGEDGGFRYTSEGKLYGAAELIAEMRESSPDWFQSTQMSGSDYKGSGDGGGSKRIYTRAEYDQLVSDPATYEAQEAELNAAWEEGRVRG